MRSRHSSAVVDEVGREHLHAFVRLQTETETETKPMSEPEPEPEPVTVSEIEAEEEADVVTDLAFRVLHFVVIVVSVYRPMRRHPPGQSCSVHACLIGVRLTPLQVSAGTAPHRGPMIRVLDLDRQDESSIPIRLQHTIFVFVIPICVEVINSSLTRYVIV